MKIAEWRQKNTAELKDLLQDYRKRAAAFRFDASRKKIKNVKELYLIKKDIARLLTILNERKL